MEILADNQDWVANISEELSRGHLRIKTAFGLLASWVIGAISSALWGAATAHNPNEDVINSMVATLTIPGAFLPVLLLAAVGFRLAWILAAVFLAIDVLNNLDSAGSMLFHIGLAALGAQAAVVFWRNSRLRTTDLTWTTCRPPNGPLEFRKPEAVRLWRRLNLVLILAVCLFQFILGSTEAAETVINGNVPLVAAAVSIVYMDVFWAATVLLSVRFWKRRPFLLWGALPLSYFGGFLVLTLSCIGCTWSHR